MLLHPLKDMPVDRGGCHDLKHRLPLAVADVPEDIRVQPGGRDLCLLGEGSRRLRKVVFVEEGKDQLHCLTEI